MFDTLYQPDLSICFMWVVALTFFFFIKAFIRGTVSWHIKIALVIILVGWLFLQWTLSVKGYYLNFTGMPPRFILAIGPPFFLISLIMILKKKAWLIVFSLKTLTWIHVVRIPVELILLGLYFDKQIPQLMTFEGRNFDILSGLTAPLIAYFCFTKNIWNKKVALVWNIICLGLLLNIVINAVLSAPFAFQKFAFDQPNVAVAFFPFVWLPAFVVPVILFSHLASIYQLITFKNNLNETNAS
ncbi:MAG: hypothetical protein ABIT08_06290 [Bacteroidia bacterium]